MATYSELLRDPRWQKRRLQIMDRDGFQCQECFDDKKTLNVHHRRYIRNRDPWEYDDGDLVTLCEDCHTEIGKSKRALDKMLSSMTGFALNRMIGFAKGVAYLEMHGNDEVELDNYYQAVGFCQTMIDPTMTHELLEMARHNFGYLTIEAYERYLESIGKARDRPGNPEKTGVKITLREYFLDGD